MPTYEYECQKCGHQFEKFQYMTEAPLKKCPKCQHASAKRLIGTGGGIIFKGSGFYATDYRKGRPSTESAGPQTCPMSKEKNPDCSSCKASKKS